MFSVLLLNEVSDVLQVIRRVYLYFCRMHWDLPESLQSMLSHMWMSFIYDKNLLALSMNDDSCDDNDDDNDS